MKRETCGKHVFPYIPWLDQTNINYAQGALKNAGIKATLEESSFHIKRFVSVVDKIRYNKALRDYHTSVRLCPDCP